MKLKFVVVFLSLGIIGSLIVFFFVILRTLICLCAIIFRKSDPFTKAASDCL